MVLGPANHIHRVSGSALHGLVLGLVVLVFVALEVKGHLLSGGGPPLQRGRGDQLAVGGLDGHVGVPAPKTPAVDHLAHDRQGQRQEQAGLLHRLTLSWDDEVVHGMLLNRGP